MNLIKEISDKTLFGSKDGSALDYNVRIAARSIVTYEGKIGLLHASKFDYYKLPGGGLEGNESIADCLYREVQEETGCEIEVIGENGVIHEYRAKHKLLQISLCFIARVIDKPGSTSFTDKELADGFELVWADSQNALELMNKNKQDIYEQRFMTVRDLTFLENFLHTRH